MKYSQESLEEMALKIDLREYAEKTVDFVKQSGDTQFAVCPFHEEKTASLAVTPEIFHCFGCGKYGNLVTFDQAVQKVADITNSDIHEYIESETLSFYKMMGKINRKKIRPVSDRNILDIDKDYYQKFKDEIPQEWVDEGILPEEMKKYEIRIDPMSNRIVYPVYSDDGKLISIKGRTRFKDYKQLNIMKYMNYYKLGLLDYFQGMKQAKPYIKDKKEIIIFEGIKSVMKVDAWGYHNSVSAETSSLNEYQIELLVKMQIRDIVIAFDKDVSVNKIRKCTELLRKKIVRLIVARKYGTSYMKGGLKFE